MDMEKDMDGVWIAGLVAAPVVGVALAVLGQDQRLQRYIRSSIGGESKSTELSESKVKASISLKDRLCFTLGVINVAVVSWIMGAGPQHYFWFYTPKVLLLTALRWWTFKSQGRHFLLLDFCYFANLAVLVYVWGDYWELFSTDMAYRLFHVSFLCANGPLAWSVLQFRHSLVFHSHPHMTSVLIHVSPLLLTYGLRWYASPFNVCTDFPACSEVGVGTMLWDAFSLFYLWWLGLYYVLVFGLLGGYLERMGYETLFDRIKKDSGVAGKLVQGAARGGPLAQRLVYMLVHLAFGTLTMVFATLLWRSQIAHFSFVLMLCAATVWNGASYYFSIFAQRYERSTQAEALRILGRDPADIDPAEETGLLRRRAPDESTLSSDVEQGAAPVGEDQEVQAVSVEGPVDVAEVKLIPSDGSTLPSASPTPAASPAASVCADDDTVEGATTPGAVGPRATARHGSDAGKAWHDRCVDDAL